MKKIKLPTTNPWFRPLRNPYHTEQHLICFHYAGGSSAMFNDWVSFVAPGVQLYAAQLPGRGVRIQEQLITRMDTIVSHLAENFTCLMDKPISLFGHSLGALIAFEFAHKIKNKMGIDIEHLIVSGRACPAGSTVKTRLHQLPEDELIVELQRLNGTPRNVFEHAELMSLALPIIRADFEMAETYQYQTRAPLDCPITVLAGQKDNTIGDHSQLFQWQQETNLQCNVTVLPGDHFFIDTHKHLVIEKINRCLSRSAACAIAN